MGNTSSNPKNKTGKRVVAQKLETAQKTNILSLTEHGLEEIPVKVYQVKNLRTLDISKNKLKSLGQISQLSELKTLKCDDNALGSNALHTLSKLPKLQILSIGNNRLHYPDPAAATTSQQSFPSLPSSVKQLKLNSNAFSSIPLQICDRMMLLEKLDLSYNNIAAVPPEICNLTALTELNLDNNTIVSLPNEVGQLRKLKVLSLRNNYIQIIKNNPQPLPASLFVDTLLIDLNLHGNSKLSSTELNEFDGFSVFLQRRKKVKTKNLYGGAMTDGDTGLCGLK